MPFIAESPRRKRPAGNRHGNPGPWTVRGGRYAIAPKPPLDTAYKDRGRYGALCVESTVSWRRSTVMYGDGAAVHGGRIAVHGDRAASSATAMRDGTSHRGDHRGTGSGTPRS